jgi:hypothetical protein
MPDHLAALQHIRTCVFRFGERYEALAWCRPCGRRARVCNRHAGLRVAEISRLSSATGERVTSAAQSIIIMLAS